MMQSIIDQPEVLRVLFHPRPDYGLPPQGPNAHPVSVQVGPNVAVGGWLYSAGPAAPAILYFHGNGEVASDYDEISTLYTQRGITLLVMDYRGYGTSGGSPTAAHLLADAAVAFDALERIFEDHGLVPAHLYVMGRSLGSAPAIQVAQYAGGQLEGLIIESGFSDTFGLLARLGAWVPEADEGRDGFNNPSKMSQITTRTLIIHGQNDVLIPPEDGQELFNRCAARDKQLVLIPNAGHNDLMLVGMMPYFEAIRAFVFGAVDA
jgi:alpha-beta hydrolase superfamily lysophospholipase